MRITGTLHEDLCTFMIKSRRIILGMGMFQTLFVEKIKTHILHSIFFFKPCRLRDNTLKYVEPYGPHVI
jgi:hypothetical protein